MRPKLSLICVLLFIIFFFTSINSGAVFDLLDKLTSSTEALQSTPEKTYSVSVNQNSYSIRNLYYEEQAQKDAQTINAPLSPKKMNCLRPDEVSHNNGYFKLDTNLDANSHKFVSELDKKVNTTFSNLEQTLEVKFEHTIPLDIYFKVTKEDYDNFVLEHGASPKGTQGKYLNWHNISIVHFINYEQGIRVAVHEAVHALNYYYWGITQRFFNEGIAQYYENISENGHIPPFDFYWFTEPQYPLMVTNLLFSKMDWHGSTEYELYQQSSALIYFLMNNEQGKRVIWRILELEGEDPCSSLSNDEIEDVFREEYENYQQEFDNWFKEGIYEYLEKNKA